MTVNPPSDERQTTTLPISLKNELEAIYRELGEEISALGVECWVRGQCCDFERAGHRLYASSVEVAYVAEAHADEELQFSGVLCPFWKNGLCTEREHRPIGCRTYFCDERYSEQLHAVYEKYYGRLRDAAAATGVEWSYGSFVEQLKQITAERRER